MATGALDDKAWGYTVGSTSQVWSRRTVSTFPYSLVACPHRVRVSLYGLYGISGILQHPANQGDGMLRRSHDHQRLSLGNATWQDGRSKVLSVKQSIGMRQEKS